MNTRRFMEYSTPEYSLKIVIILISTCHLTLADRLSISGPDAVFTDDTSPKYIISLSEEYPPTTTFTYAINLKVTDTFDHSEAKAIKNYQTILSNSRIAELQLNLTDILEKKNTKKGGMISLGIMVKVSVKEGDLIKQGAEGSKEVLVTDDFQGFFDCIITQSTDPNSAPESAFLLSKEVHFSVTPKNISSIISSAPGSSFTYIWQLTDSSRKHLFKPSPVTIRKQAFSHKFRSPGGKYTATVLISAKLPGQTRKGRIVKQFSIVESKAAQPSETLNRLRIIGRRILEDATQGPVEFVAMLLTNLWSTSKKVFSILTGINFVG